MNSLYIDLIASQQHICVGFCCVHYVIYFLTSQLMGVIVITFVVFSLGYNF